MHPLRARRSTAQFPILIALVLGAMASGCVLAAASFQYEVHSEEPATLTFWNRPIATLYADIEGIRPTDRVQRIGHKIEDIRKTTPRDKASAAPATLGNLSGYWIMSPYFRDQPAEKVWVPKKHWHAAPARDGGG